MKIIGRQDNFILFSRTSRDKDKVTKQINGFNIFTSKDTIGSCCVFRYSTPKTCGLYYAVKYYTR